MTDLAGKTTTAAIPSVKAGHPDMDDDTSPLLSRRQWIGLAWGAFTAGLAGGTRIHGSHDVSERPR